jgi:uncharacterized OB-fold protein
VKFLPQPTPLSAPYWRAAREGRLVVQRCTSCGHLQFYPRSLCTRCTGARLAWHECSGRGSVRSFTVIRRAVSAAYEPEVPYVVALIELAEGPTLLSNVVGCAPEAVQVGAPVRVRFEAWTPEVTVPVFTLAP